MKSRRAYGPLPPGPRAPAPVNMARLAQHPIESLVGWRERYGDVYTVPLIVFGVGVYVCDPEAIRGMLTGDQSDLHAGEANAPLSPVLGDRSLLTLDGREHKLLLPPFQGSAVQTFREVIRDIGGEEEELDGDELLRALLGCMGEDTMAGEAPNDDEARHALDAGIEAEADEGDRGGDDAGGDRHRSLDRHPAEREPGKQAHAAGELFIALA
jgi:cytochrome P450